MTHPDDLKLAAFVEGHLSKADRQKVLLHLADCSTCSELVAETQQFLVGSQGSAVSELPRRSLATARPSRRWFISAAVAAALAWAVPGLWRVAGPVAAGLSAELAGQIGPELSDDLVDRVWSYQTAGLSFAAPLTAEQANFRWGVASIDLEVAAARGDRRAVEVVRAGLESWQDSAPELRAAKAVIAALASDDPSRWLDRLRRLESRLQESAEPSAFPLGRWVEAGRLAALAGDEALLRRILASAPRPPVVDPSISAEIAEIDALTPAGASAWRRNSLRVAPRLFPWRKQSSNSSTTSSPSPMTQRSMKSLIGSGFREQVPPAITRGWVSFLSAARTGIPARSSIFNTLV